MWTLTYSVRGKKHVQVIPVAWVADLAPLIAAARRYRDVVAEVATINAQLVRLWREQRRPRR
jgi:hypothetical protein